MVTYHKEMEDTTDRRMHKYTYVNRYYICIYMRHQLLLHFPAD